jgi:hypothetical protein
MDYAVLMLPNQKTAHHISELETMTYGQSNGDTLFWDTKTEVEEKSLFEWND